MNRGELWTVAGGVYASEPRPALILQDDRFDATDSVTVAPLTRTFVDAPLLRIPLAATEVSGLRAASQVMIDKVTTVTRSNVQERMGRLTSAQMVEVERALLAFLGLAG
ncbi:type II toxin-antitoxin system PemK/MazF family toxin [Agromyces archimandritae]|uniref:Type II toxin-antitoxin system PemK/MazF family toxin n=1 Tax=Agromyces archimandritae TaxID=2781962 RepID=A0A975FMI0_9MICO|nr:type II toxin-antitoxin system PemK/MazF family toxin [Agromyces archimandritae]QTX05175.1 type II toxin-antitoxin system PemK/MazF family toxin [Agromyces archimandritae]